jgi:hypothetical protein
MRHFRTLSAGLISHDQSSSLVFSFCCHESQQKTSSNRPYRADRSADWSWLKPQTYKDADIPHFPPKTEEEVHKTSDQSDQFPQFPFLQIRFFDFEFCFFFENIPRRGKITQGGSFVQTQGRRTEAGPDTARGDLTARAPAYARNDHWPQRLWKIHVP